jgi:hypothetical protein
MPSFKLGISKCLALTWRHMLLGKFARLLRSAMQCPIEEYEERRVNNVAHSTKAPKSDLLMLLDVVR